MDTINPPPPGFAPYQPPMPPTPPPAQTSTVFSPPPAPKAKGSGKSILLVVVLVLLLAGAGLAFTRIGPLLSGAAGSDSCSVVPNTIKENNKTPNSVEISFQTTGSCAASIAYGTSQGALLLETTKEQIPSNTHRIRLSPLASKMTYFYQVISDGKRLGTVESFMTPEQTAAEIIPTVAAAVPTIVAKLSPPATPSGTSAYTLDDFQTNFGSVSAVFDVDKNGIVNMRDWLLYQKNRAK